MPTTDMSSLHGVPHLALTGILPQPHPSRRHSMSMVQKPSRTSLDPAGLCIHAHQPPLFPLPSSCQPSYLSHKYLGRLPPPPFQSTGPEMLEMGANLENRGLGFSLFLLAFFLLSEPEWVVTDTLAQICAIIMITWATAMVVSPRLPLEGSTVHQACEPLTTILCSNFARWCHQDRHSLCSRLSTDGII